MGARKKVWLYVKTVARRDLHHGARDRDQVFPSVSAQRATDATLCLASHLRSCEYAHFYIFSIQNNARNIFFLSRPAGFNTKPSSNYPSPPWEWLGEAT